jgi:RimJ/RimL family protein N-acetyltransferase
MAGWHDAGFLGRPIRWDDRKLLSKVGAAIEELEEAGARSKRSSAGSKSIDGEGALRIRDFILDRVNKERGGEMKLRPAGKNDSREIWLWRNSEKARRASFNAGRIPWARHQGWFSSKIADNSSRIYIAEGGADKIGVVRFDSKGKRIYVSVNLNPCFIGKGFGSRVIKSGTEKFLAQLKKPCRIIAEIKRDNTASRKAFAAAGYENIKSGRGKVVYMMENPDEK